MRYSGGQKSERTLVKRAEMTAPIGKEPIGERASGNADSHPASNGWIPATEADRDSARTQLAKMVAHPLFANSKRYPALLRHVVECSLEGTADNLKERTLGIEVFGRKADYDTNLDPVVRITAGEIRKRIAQYYHEPEHEAELRIDLPSGSYVPQFHLPHPVRPATIANDSDPIPPIQSIPTTGITPTSRSGSRFSTPLLLALACGLAALAILVISMKAWSAKDGLDQFWGPILEAPGPVLISIGQPSMGNDQDRTATTNSQETVSEHIHHVDHIVLPDATALVSLSGFLAKAGKPCSVQGSTSTTLTDLRQGSTILISAFDNPWTLRLTEPLRFHFVRQTGSSLRSIEDRQDPSNRWSVDFGSPYAKLTEDYAIVGRYWDATTGQLMMVAAGIGTHGTITAGEFLTRKQFLDEVLRQIPKDSTHRNIEVVIATRVIDGKSGPPRIEAIHSW
jgi:hypothetical protein